MMSQTLLLTSAGMRMQDEILKLLPKSPAQTKLAHIITASNEVSPHPWRDNDKKAMLKLGIQVEDIDIKGDTERQRCNLRPGRKSILSIETCKGKQIRQSG